MTTNTVQAPVSRGRTIGFYVTVVVTGLLIVLGLFEAFTLTVRSWLPTTILEELYGEDIAAIDSHRIHLFGVAIISWLALLPVAVQLVRPVTKVAPAVFALVGYTVVTVIDLASGLVDPTGPVLVVLAAIIFWLHPGRPEMTLTPMTSRSLTVALVGGVGWLVYAAMEIGEQLTGIASNEHVEFHHFGIMGEIASLGVIAALIGATALAGNRIVALLSGGAAAYLGLASMVFPDYESSLGVPLGIVAIVWAAVYLWSVFSEAKHDGAI